MQSSGPPVSVVVTTYRTFEKTSQKFCRPKCRKGRCDPVVRTEFPWWNGLGIVLDVGDPYNWPAAAKKAGV